MSEYVVEPPDLLLVEVLEALPGRPDFRRTPGAAGRQDLARLLRRCLRRWPHRAASQGEDRSAPSKVLFRIRNWAWLSRMRQTTRWMRHRLRLERTTPFGESPTPPSTSEKPRPGGPPPPVSSGGQKIRVEPRDSDRVFVDITAYNSKVYYTQGEVFTPGRLPITGRESTRRDRFCRRLDAGCRPRAGLSLQTTCRRGSGRNLEDRHRPAHARRRRFDPIINWCPATGWSFGDVGIRIGNSKEPRRDRRATALRSRSAISATSTGGLVPRKVAGLEARRQDSRAENAGLLRLEQRMTELEQKLDRKLDMILEAVGKPGRSEWVQLLT